jgi:hypothetical protein
MFFPSSLNQITLRDPPSAGLSLLDIKHFLQIVFLFILDALQGIGSVIFGHCQVEAGSWCLF